VARALVALGSNEGDRERTLDAAAEALCRLPGTCVVARSRNYETRPVGGPPQGDFLNAVVEVETRLAPRELLLGLLEIERSLGRARAERNGPRTIDLDLVLMGERVASEPGLELPHPRFRDRGFVLAPLAEVAPDARDPVTGLTARELYDAWRERTGERL
jgi:2-amino-4-hydroxy-6-hydroxymethyldihydropteridine diphosphokinase